MSGRQGKAVVLPRRHGGRRTEVGSPISDLLLLFGIGLPNHFHEQSAGKESEQLAGGGERG